MMSMDAASLPPTMQLFLLSRQTWSSFKASLLLGRQPWRHTADSRHFVRRFPTLREWKADLEFSRLESWSRDVSRPFLTSLGLGLSLGTLESWSRSWSWNLRVLVLVLVLDLGSLESRSRSWDLGQWRVRRAASIAKQSSVCLSPLLLRNGYSATVVCWCRQIWLEWVTTCCHSWSTCDAAISCKFFMLLLSCD